MELKPGQFTGKWEVFSEESGVVLATGMDKGEAANLIDNHHRNHYRTDMRRARVPVPPDIAALDAGDDE